MQTELHRHLDVCTRPSTLYEEGQRQGLISLSTSLDSFKQNLLLKTPLKNLETVLDQFLMFPKIINTPERIERVAFEGVEDCFNEGTKRVELRFSPSFWASFSKLSWGTILESVKKGVLRATQMYPSIEVGLLCIASREFGEDSVHKTAEFCIQTRKDWVGFDLAGAENTPARNFESTFKRLKAEGIPCTVHAGESSGPDQVWEAIDFLHAKRIGHGIASIRDPQLIEELKKRRICLEVCPTSNWLTSCVKSLKEHPLPQFIKSSVPVSINTDDPGIFGISLPQEYEVCRTHMGLTDADIQMCNQTAFKASFLSAH